MGKTAKDTKEPKATKEPKVPENTKESPTYRVVQGKTPADVAGLMKKYVVTQLGGLSEVKTYWYQTFMGYPDPNYVAPPKKAVPKPKPRKLKQGKDVALGNQPSAAPVGNFAGNTVQEGYIPEDML